MAVDYSTLKKGGFMRQKQKNCFSLRLAVVGGNLTAENLKTIAEVADKYGDGHVHLTSRQSVEIPFIKLDDIDAVKEDLAKGGCKPGVCGPRVRTITSCQGNQICWLMKMVSGALPFAAFPPECFGFRMNVQQRLRFRQCGNI